MNSLDLALAQPSTVLFQKSVLLERQPSPEHMSPDLHQSRKNEKSQAEESCSLILFLLSNHRASMHKAVSAKVNRLGSGFPSFLLLCLLKVPFPNRISPSVKQETRWPSHCSWQCFWDLSFTFWKSTNVRLYSNAICIPTPLLGITARLMAVSGIMKCHQEQRHLHLDAFYVSNNSEIIIIWSAQVQRGCPSPF